MTIFCLLIGIFFYSVTESIATDCRLPGVLYQGTKNITETGRPCQRWDAQTPHEHGYDVFSIAQENYCRNFDREEPWCFTNDSNVRWELCGVEICETPCLNQSFYTKEISSQCVSGITSDSEYCSNILNLVSCLKKNIENRTGVNCPQITWRSIALQIKGTLEKLTGKSISQCILSPCRDPSVIGDSFVVINFAIPCYSQFIMNATGDELCRIKQRIGHCVISRVQDSDKTRSTCVVKDKITMANRFLSLLPAQIQQNASLCVKYFYSEFPAPLENITDTKIPAESPETNSDVSQTAIFLVVGFAVALIFAVSFAISIYKIRAITLRKRRKELMRLPSIPKSKDSPYEIKLTYPDGPYFDPDYEIVEEQDEGYEHLPGPEVNPFTLSLTDEDGPYTDLNNADGTYLDVVHSKKEPNDYVNDSPYIDLVDDTIDNHLESESDILQSETAETINLPETIDTERNKELNDDFPP
ncbi:uncharacterized protein LOC133204069 isoform X2 [Saccostrea echinata]|uniref:uncharacterized protein LOC133204069 isoform X2 n=1 Tax=Saccostrea echinata TaxID=191078 RepID=UPI002A82A94B|nr:uncharacterized protein LOC133204069 isoform X2 [Saccostrea echinata]